MSALRVVSYDSLPSTQDEARRRVLAGERVDGWVVRAAVQTAGRGQRARDWQAGPGGSYQTLIVRQPELMGTKGVAPPQTALVLALGLVETLPIYGVHAGLKWPNDVYYLGKKLAGVLVERVAGYLLIGVGLNVNNEVPPGATGLRGWDVEGAHMVVLEGLQRGLAHLMDPTFEVSPASEPFDLLRGEALELATPNATYAGRGRGVDNEGKLLLEDAAGRVQAFSRGHLTVFTLRRDPRQPQKI